MVFRPFTRHSPIPGSGGVASAPIVSLRDLLGAAVVYEWDFSNVTTSGANLLTATDNVNGLLLDSPVSVTYSATGGGQGNPVATFNAASSTFQSSMAVTLMSAATTMVVAVLKPRAANQVGKSMFALSLGRTRYYSMTNGEFHSLQNDGSVSDLIIAPATTALATLDQWQLVTGGQTKGTLVYGRVNSVTGTAASVRSPVIETSAAQIGFGSNAFLADYAYFALVNGVGALSNAQVTTLTPWLQSRFGCNPA